MGARSAFVDDHGVLLAASERERKIRRRRTFREGETAWWWLGSGFLHDSAGSCDTGCLVPSRFSLSLIYDWPHWAGLDIGVSAVHG